MEALALTMTKPQKFTNWEDVPLILSTRQVADLLGVHPNTVKLLYDKGKLKGFEVGRLLKFNRDDVMRYAGILPPKEEDEKQ